MKKYMNLLWVSKDQSDSQFEVVLLSCWLGLEDIASNIFGLSEKSEKKIINFLNKNSKLIVL